MSHDSDHIPLRGSQGSLTNGPISSGYQSLNYSTSNSSSPVEANQTQKKSYHHVTSTNGHVKTLKPVTNGNNHHSSHSQQSPPALAISNPLYCLQTVPLLKQQKATCYSLPDIQQEINNPSSMSNGGTESIFDDHNRLLTPNGSKPNQHHWHRGSSAAVAIQKQFGPRSTRVFTTD